MVRNQGISAGKRRVVDRKRGISKLGKKHTRTGSEGYSTLPVEKGGESGQEVRDVGKAGEKWTGSVG